ncbi:unnamed protein product [Pylaiella littoralis]
MKKNTQKKREPSCCGGGVVDLSEDCGGGVPAAKAMGHSLHEKKTQQQQQQQQQQQHPPFVVVGLLGEFGDRVLLLPTTAERRRAMGAAASDSSAVPLTWADSAGRSRTARLTKTKAKPVVCNPLPMLATLVAWMGEFSAEALPLPEKKRPLLPALQSSSSSSASASASASPIQRAFSNKTFSSHSSNGNGNGNCGSNSGGSDSSSSSGTNSSTSTSTSISSTSSTNAANLTNDNENGDSAFGGELSLGAAWLLGHLVFGREGGAEQRRIFGRARASPSGKVGLFGGEAAALALLSCPLIGWSPNPREVMQAMSEGGGSLISYSVSPSEFDKENGVAGAETVGGGGGWGDEGRVAVDELVRAGLGQKSRVEGLLILAPKMELTSELVLEVFLDSHWDPDRQMMARIALGLMKTGPMGSGMCLPAVPALLANQDGCSERDCGVFQGGRTTEGTVRGSVGSGDSGGRGGDHGMCGLVGELCIELHSFCLEVTRPAADGRVDLSILRRISKKESGPHPAANPYFWDGPMAEALALLGGALVPATSRSSSGSSGSSSSSSSGGGGRSSSSGSAGGTADASADDGAVRGPASNRCGWVASLSRRERLEDLACFRLKEAAGHAVKVIGFVVEGLQKQKMYQEAVALLRLLVRRDKGMAGPKYRGAPDLTWAAAWVTNNHRGYAYTRLAVNLKHLNRPGRAQLAAVQDACEDDGVRGGERIDLQERCDSLQKKFGGSQDSPAKEKIFHPVEETMVVCMDTVKEGNQRSMSGGRKLYFDRPDFGGGQHWGADNALNVEQVLLRERYRSGGWLGLHCESSLNQFLVVLLLWEEIFDENVAAAIPHCITNRPVDLQDKFFWVRRAAGLSRRLLTISRCSDDQLWSDVGRRYERYNGVRAVWCDWKRFPKQQVMEISVAFGGRRLSELLRTTTSNIPHLCYGFPDVVLWKPKGFKDAAGVSDNGIDWKVKDRFGLDWRGLGRGWEVEVVEVKSKGDITSNAQKAWLMELQNARVPAMVTRVLAEKEAAEDGFGCS